MLCTNDPIQIWAVAAILWSKQTTQNRLHAVWCIPKNTGQYSLRATRSTGCMQNRTFKPFLKIFRVFFFSLYEALLKWSNFMQPKNCCALHFCKAATVYYISGQQPADRGPHAAPGAVLSGPPMTSEHSPPLVTPLVTRGLHGSFDLKWG